jgi:SAM-dependent methyltransferase
VDANPNQDIYNRNYVPAQLDLSTLSPWDRALVDLRMALIREHGAGRDVVDLCCGTGSYLIPNLQLVRTAVGVDFSETMLMELRTRAGADPKLTIVNEDVQELSLPSASADFVWSYTSLYAVPGLDRVLAHVARILRPGGHAALELGNSRSLNELVSRVQHRDAGWAKPYYRPYPDLRRAVAGAGLEVVEWRSFQVLSMYGAPRRLRVLTPLLTARWKTVLGRRVRGRTLEEWISSAGPMRRLAFRHLVLARSRDDSRR